jgi:hypothetical protein
MLGAKVAEEALWLKPRAEKRQSPLRGLQATNKTYITSEGDEDTHGPQGIKDQEDHQQHPTK